MTAKTSERPGEASKATGEARTSGVELASERWRASLPRVTAGELAWALRRAGFEPRLDGPEHIAMVKDRVILVRVPIHQSGEMLHPALIAAVLRTLRVTPAQLSEYLDLD
jgi:hypothetical protein